MKRHYQLIVFIFLMLLIITLIIIGAISKDLKIILASYLSSLLLIIILVLTKALAYAKARKYLFLILVIISLIAYSFLLYKNLLIGFELNDVYIERENIEIQIRNEENDLIIDQLYDNLGELLDKSLNLNLKKNLNGFLLQLSIFIIGILPITKKDNDEEVNYSE
ncbi:MAG: hypothetical protein PHX62_06015 [Bacilli bacterium]|nr:hypothetical protein [Bacilli bacterium]